MCFIRCMWHMQRQKYYNLIDNKTCGRTSESTKNILCLFSRKTNLHKLMNYLLMFQSGLYFKVPGHSNLQYQGGPIQNDTPIYKYVRKRRFSANIGKTKSIISILQKQKHIQNFEIFKKITVQSGTLLRSAFTLPSRVRQRLKQP